jgi:anti-anti-sigma factor
MAEASLKTEELPGGITLVRLIGRIDTAGAAALDLKMQAIAEAHPAVVIDLTQVDFLASMGIRILAQSAQIIAKKAGRVACFGANENVNRVLVTSGMTSLLPVLGRLEMATASVTH